MLNPLQISNIPASVTTHQALSPPLSKRASARSSLELKAAAHESDRSAGLTWVNVDLVQMGLCCIDSWSRLPFDQYLVPLQEYNFEFKIAPPLR